MIVDSGGSDHLMDEKLIPRLRKSMRDYKKLKEPKTIMTYGNKKVFATATGTIGDTSSTRLASVFLFASRPCSYLDSEAASSPLSKQSGVSTILEAGNPYLQFDSSTSLPPTQHPEDKGVCYYDVFPRTLGGTADTSSTPAVVPEAQASNNANRGDRTFTETQ